MCLLYPISISIKILLYRGYKLKALLTCTEESSLSILQGHNSSVSAYVMPQEAGLELLINNKTLISMRSNFKISPLFINSRLFWGLQPFHACVECSVMTPTSYEFMAVYTSKIGNAAIIKYDTIPKLIACFTQNSLLRRNRLTEEDEI